MQLKTFGSIFVLAASLGLAACGGDDDVDALGAEAGVSGNAGETRENPDQDGQPTARQGGGEARAGGSRDDPGTMRADAGNESTVDDRSFRKEFDNMTYGKNEAIAARDGEMNPLEGDGTGDDSGTDRGGDPDDEGGSR